MDEESQDFSSILEGLESGDIQAQREAIDAKIAGLEAGFESLPETQYIYYNSETDVTRTFDTEQKNRQGVGQLQEVINPREDVQRQIDALQNTEIFQSTSSEQELDEGVIRQLQIDLIDKLIPFTDDILARGGRAADLFETALTEFREEGPSAIALKAEELAGLAGDRLTGLLTGEGGISERLKRDKIEAFNKLKQNLAERGHFILGDDPDTATGFSSAAISSLGALQERFLIAEETERQNARTTGIAGFTSLAGFSEGLSRTRTSDIASLTTQLPNIGTQAGATAFSLQGAGLAAAAVPSPTELQDFSLEQIDLQGQFNIDAAHAGQPGTDPFGDFIKTLVPLGAAAIASSKRFKKNIQELEIDSKSGLRIVSFTWKNSNKKDVGLIAEEVATILPKAIFKDSTGKIDGLIINKLPKDVVIKINRHRKEIL